MLPHRIHFLFIVFLIVSGMSFVSCSTGPTKEELAAKQKQERLADEQRRAEKLAAIKKEKLAAEKKAAEQEDAIQMKEIQIPASPESEKLTETESKLTPLAPKKVSTSLEIPTALDTYLITMEQKNISHPFYGIGDKRGFALNGEQGKYVIARRNHPLTFQVRTNPMHDFYISTSEKGWGAAAYRAGVSGQFTYNGNVTLTANSQTPDILYYGCRNHNSMGGKIVVVDEDADLAELAKKLDAEYARYAERSKIAIVKKVDPKTVKQKIAYVGMLVKFKGNRLSASQLDFVKEKLELAKSLEALGDMAGALGASQEAVVVFNTKASQVGPSEEELAEQKERFNDLLVTLEAFIDAHLASYKQAKEEGRKTVSYDSDAVGALIVEAKNLADKQQYEAAGKEIKKAERQVTGALNQMLNAQTIVYDLNFKTPAEEFNYEVNRYKGYAELIPVAIEVKNPSASAIKFAKTYQDKAEFFKEKAHEAAEAGRWDEALVVIRDATIEVRRSLRILGVSM